MKRLFLLLGACLPCFAVGGGCLTSFTQTINTVAVQFYYGCIYSNYSLNSTYSVQSPRYYNVAFLPGTANNAAGLMMKQTIGGGWGYSKAPIATFTGTWSNGASSISVAMPDSSWGTYFSATAGTAVLVGTGLQAGTRVTSWTFTNPATVGISLPASSAETNVSITVIPDGPSTSEQSWWQQILSGTVSGMGPAPVAIYEPIYSTSMLRMAIAPFAAGSSVSVSLLGAIGGTWTWPYSGTYTVTIDQGFGNQETSTVTAQSSQLNPATITLGTVANAHNTINVWLLDFPGWGGNPATCSSASPCNLSFSAPLTGPAWTTYPQGTYYFDANGHVQQGSINITSNGSPGSATAMPVVSFPTGGVQFDTTTAPGCTGSNHCTPTVFGSTIAITASQFPVMQQDISCFDSFFATCSGSNYGTGACAPFTGPLPGTATQQRNTGDSAGSQIALVDAWATPGTFLNNTAATTGYCEWTSTAWAVQRAAPWSPPIDMSYMWNHAYQNAADFAIVAVLGPKMTLASDMSPLTYLPTSVPTELFVGAADTTTPATQVNEACGGNVTCSVAPACPASNTLHLSTSQTSGSSTVVVGGGNISTQPIPQFWVVDPTQATSNYEIESILATSSSNTQPVGRGELGTAAVAHTAGASTDVQSGCPHEMDSTTTGLLSLNPSAAFMFPPSAGGSTLRGACIGCVFK